MSAPTLAPPTHRSSSPRRPPASTALIAFAACEPAAALERAGSGAHGLTADEAAARLASVGPNEVAAAEREHWLWRLARAFANPLVVLLAALALIAVATRDYVGASVMGLMIGVGVLLRFVQESRAGAAAARLRAMIRVTAAVERDGEVRELPLGELVPGDVVHLAAGDMIPADVRLLSAKDLFVNQAALTGESMPVEKGEQADARPGVAPHELSCLCFLGASVQSGAATAVVIATGPATAFGRIAASVAATEPPSSFDRGVSRFTWLMIRLIVVMAPLVFLINGVTKHDWREAFFFALAVAVGLTPEMLPMIVSVSLSRGAVAMSKARVIVKRLSAIQNVGAMDVLCADKTGTLTMDRVLLERHCDVEGAESETVLRDALLVSHFQTGLRNVLDRAIIEHGIAHAVPLEEWSRVDEIPFDFSRRLMSVVVESRGGERRLIAKGAPEAVFARCAEFELEGTRYPVVAAMLDSLGEEYDELSREGFRVLAVASRSVAPRASYSRDDERDLVLTGYVAFLDPPRETAAPALAALERDGVAVKILTGDNELVTRAIAAHVGLPERAVVLGADVDRLSDAELQGEAERANVFARLTPAHKERIILALQAGGHTVGFLGDGINDAPALHAADVGISVESAVDVAKESADIILLEKSLMVLHDGVIAGRRVFANVLKYVRMGASSNFGNMLSVVGASALLPFLPMAPLQVLTNNLLYDVSQLPIPTDRVDHDQVAVPRPWSMEAITRFIFAVGPISSFFDYTTYAAMWFLFGARTPERAALFQTGWFVESLMTQTLIIHVIRTRRIPLLQSRASWPLLATTVLVMATGAWLPFSPIAPALGLVALPAAYWPVLGATLVAYALVGQGVKMLLARRGWL